MSFKKTISGVCKGHLDLFLIRFVQVYMKLIKRYQLTPEVKPPHHLESRDA